MCIARNFDKSLVIHYASIADIAARSVSL